MSKRSDPTWIMVEKERAGVIEMCRYLAAVKSPWSKKNDLQWRLFWADGFMQHLSSLAYP